MKGFRIIAFTYKTAGVDGLAEFCLPEEEVDDRLTTVREHCLLDEIMYLGTCNRVELIIWSGQNEMPFRLEQFLSCLYPELDQRVLKNAVKMARVYEGTDAAEHLFRVAASLDSLVVGEREIIAQVRNAYEQCKKSGHAGDNIRLLVQKTIQTAKQVYTETGIARKPVSVVSLAYRKLKALNVPLDARIMFVGAGKTNKAMAKFLKKHGFTRFYVFNRTLSRAHELAEELNGKAFSLNSLKEYKEGFDVLITCTGATESIITPSLYKSLVGPDKSRKVVVDLAVPNDFDESILKGHQVNLIAINNLKEIAEANLRERKKELSGCEKIITAMLDDFQQTHRVRQIELAMQQIPGQVKEIHRKALQEVFANDIASLDEQSKELLDKVLGYVEKKYIAMPMKMAKDIMLESKVSDSKPQISSRPARCR